MILNNFIFPNKIEGAYQKFLIKSDKIVVKTKEFLNGFDIISLRNLKNIFTNKFNIISNELNHEEQKVELLCNLSGIIANFCVVLSQMGGISISIITFLNGKIEFGELLAAVQISFFLNEPIIKLINSLLSYRSNVYLESELKEILSTNEKEKNVIDVKSISIKNLNYKYGEEKSSIFENFSYYFEMNKKYLIVGESGIGKTTLFKILLGKVVPNSGEIIYNDSIPHDIVSKSVLFEIPQDIFVFDDTIRNNIDLEQICSEDEINDVVKKVKLNKLVLSRENGINSIINQEI